MRKLSTLSLLALCREGIKLENEAIDTAARELGSWIVFSSLYEEFTEVSDELDKRVLLLEFAVANPSKYPKDMEDEVEGHPDQVDDPNLPEDDPGPLVA
jgi:hypothetical protein